MKTAKRVKCCMSLKDQLTMPAKSIQKCLPKDMLTKFKEWHKVIEEDSKDFTTYTSSPRPLLLEWHKYKKILAFRFRIANVFVPDTLKSTKNLLLQHPESLGGRGNYEIPNYCLLTKYADHSYMCANPIEDEMTNYQWLDKLISNKANSLGQMISMAYVAPTEQVRLHTF